MSFVRGSLLPLLAAAAMLPVPAAPVDFESFIDPRVQVVNGGIGREEADTLRAQAPSFALEVIFTRHADNSDEFIANVHLRIVDGLGRAVIDGNAGPIFLAQLPDGQYTLMAEYRGQTQMRRVAIADGQRQRFSLVWS